MKGIAFLAFLGCGVLCAADPNGQTVTGPYTHDNLSVFLIHGPSASGVPRYTPLKDAMESGMVIVHETKQVNQLAIENVSNEAVFIQGGDIVKGGQQDRTLTNDFILPPHSGKLPISAFCVEHGRWTQRGSESPQTFSSSAMMAPLRVKTAAVADGNQQRVWASVATVQAEVASTTALASQARTVSPTSLQLTLENAKVAEATARYVKDLSRATKGNRDVVGAVFAINGNPVSADLYATAELFTAVWPKLLNSMAFEAQRSRKEGAPAAPALATAEAFLGRGAEGQTISGPGSRGRKSAIA